MATDNEIKLFSGRAQSLSESMAGLKSAVDRFLADNSAEAIDWSNLASSNPDQVVTNPGKPDNGTIVDYDFTPAEMSNFIGSLDAFANDSTGWASTHMGNVRKLAKP